MARRAESRGPHSRPPCADVDEYLFKTILTIGIYKGGREERDATVEPAFDSEVTHRAGFGTALAPMDPSTMVRSEGTRP